MRADLFQPDYEAGQAVISIIRSVIWPDHAATLHAYVGRALQAEGFKVTYEFKTRSLGDPRDGRIDLLAVRNGGVVAIELDTRRPRKRSLLKLRLADAFRLIVLRGVEGYDVPEGIDAVIAAPVRMASVAERSDKRTTNRWAA